jgi:2-dehydropantoate 2-reductase
VAQRPQGNAHRSGGVSDDRLLIVGTGAMACLFAGLLAEAADVTLLGTWSEGIQAVNASGIRLHTEGGERVLRVGATDDLRACAGIRRALVLVKAWQTPRAAEQLLQCLAPDGVALSLQNGVGNWETLCESLGEARAAAGVTRMGAMLLAPGVVRLGGRGPTTLGAHERLGPLEQCLHAGGLEIERVDDLAGVLWGKLAVNAGINPVSALLRLRNGELLQRPGARAVMRQAAAEVQTVAEAMGIALPFPDAAEQAESAALASADNSSSMLQDVRRGARTEIDAINGAVVRMAEVACVQAPVNRLLWQLVSAMTPGEPSQ